MAAMYRRVHPILDGLRRRGTTVYLVSCRTRVLASRSKQSARIAGSANAQGAIESLPMRHLVNIFHPDCDRTVRKWIGQGEHSSISAANEGERLLDRGSANFGKTHSGLQEVVKPAAGRPERCEDSLLRPGKARSWSNRSPPRSLSVRYPPVYMLFCLTKVRLASLCLVRRSPHLVAIEKKLPSQDQQPYPQRKP